MDSSNIPSDAFTKTLLSADYNRKRRFINGIVPLDLTSKLVDPHESSRVSTYGVY